MNDKEIVAVLKEIVGRTARCFYEDRFVIALDFLNRHPALVSDLCISLTRRLKDDELAVFMRLKTRDLHKIMGRLVDSSGDEGIQTIRFIKCSFVPLILLLSRLPTVYKRVKVQLYRLTQVFKDRMKN